MLDMLLANIINCYIICHVPCDYHGIKRNAYLMADAKMISYGPVEYC